MDLRLVLGQHPSLIIIGSTATMFKGTEPGEATLTSAASSMITDHDSHIKVRNPPQDGTWDSYIEGSTTSYIDASRYQYGTGSSTYSLL